MQWIWKQIVWPVTEKDAKELQKMTLFFDLSVKDIDNVVVAAWWKAFTMQQMVPATATANG